MLKKAPKETIDQTKRFNLSLKIREVCRPHPTVPGMWEYDEGWGDARIAKMFDIGSHDTVARQRVAVCGHIQPSRTPGIKAEKLRDLERDATEFRDRLCVLETAVRSLGELVQTLLSTYSVEATE